MKEFYAEIDDQLKEYENGTITISEDIDFSMRQTVRQITHYTMSKYMNKQTDEQGRRKPFRNIGNAIVDLEWRSQRSGVDFLSLLAGGEFQKVLPGFIRGLGGGGAVGVGASLINPYLLLLAPLFSPRVVGSIARNAPAAAKTASQVARAATVQATPAVSKAAASPQGGSPSQ